MEKYLLTTADNPYNPWTMWDEWYAWDELDAKKSNRSTCCGYLARVAPLSDEISENEYTQVMNDIIDEIIKLNLCGKFIAIAQNGEKVVQLSSIN